MNVTSVDKLYQPIDPQAVSLTSQIIKANDKTVPFIINENVYIPSEILEDHIFSFLSAKDLQNLVTTNKC